jgi:hypothetical protein
VAITNVSQTLKFSLFLALLDCDLCPLLDAEQMLPRHQECAKIKDVEKGNQ